AIQIASGAALSTDGGALSPDATITNAGTFALTDGGSETVNSVNGAGAVQLSSSSVLTLDAGTSEVSGVVSGGGGLAVAGTSNTTLSGINTYTGATTVAAGTLNVTGGAALPDAALTTVAAGATLDVLASETVGALAGAGSVALTGGTLTTGGNNSSTAFSGNVSGGGVLVKQGSGTFTLSGTNTHAGGTTVNAGTLELASAGALAIRASGTSAADPDLAANNASTVLASVSNAMAGGYQSFNGDSQLDANAEQAVNGGTQTFFDNSQLNANAQSSISSGAQIFRDDSRLNASVAQAISGGQSEFLDSAQLNADAGQAISGGSQIFRNSAQLNADVPQAISGGQSEFLGSAQLNADAAQAIVGGIQYFYENSRLNANSTGAVDGGAQMLRESGLLRVGAVDALTARADVNFAFNHQPTVTDLSGGVLALNGFSTTVGALRSEGGAGVILNGGADATLTLDSSILGDSAFSGRIIDSDAKAGGLLALVKTGVGTFTLSGTNTYAGGTTVSAGTLAVGAGGKGSLAGHVDVQGGATLGGSGTIGGNVSVAKGATLAPGNSIGTLSIGGDLTLSAGSRLAFEFGKPSGSFSTPGDSDRVSVGGNLTLGGATLDVIDVGGLDGMGAGLYRLFDYAGTRTGTVAMGSTPPDATALSVQYLDGAGQVNLIDARGTTLNLWNANGLATAKDMGGGTGIWSANSAVWTDINATGNGPMLPQPGFAIFGGQPGTVTLDASEGALSATGLQFVSDGYTLNGDTLTLVGTAPGIRVGAGAAGDASLTATITAPIAGSDGLVKRDGGTLVLGGSNGYTGDTAVVGGTLRAGAANTFSAASAMNVANGATLDLGGFSQTVAGMTNAGTVRLLSGTPGTVLTVTGPWVGQGGTLAVGTKLGNSNSVTDRVMLSGATAIASGTTNVAVTNLGGLGGQTTGSGIAVVSTESGASIDGQAFTMAK
ncbi:MAG: hypothetical protein EOO29_24690, partial [Comamonadaceae bacterium]